MAMDIVRTMELAPRRSPSRQAGAALSAVRDGQPGARAWAELREQLAARAAELQQSVLAAKESARRYDAVGDHLQGGMQWRKSHLDEVRLAELERAYALVDDLARRDLLPREQSRRDQPRRDLPGLAA